MNFRDLLLVLSLTANVAYFATPAQEPGVGQLGRPRAEHKILNLFAGGWKAESLYKDEDMGEFKALGRETSELVCTGKWLVQDLEAEVLGAPYRGHGILGFDPNKRRYVGVWIDDQLDHLSLSEGSWDRDARQLTMYAQTRDRYGKPAAQKMVTTFRDDGTRHEEVFIATGGEETSIYETVYERDK
jgi:hypothetical protein